MARRRRAGRARAGGFPHPRGDGPPSPWTEVQLPLISPPAWGWPHRGPGDGQTDADFPTRVGMARMTPAPTTAPPRFPHPRGDGPHADKKCRLVPLISPPAWGWPAGAAGRRQLDADFPTRVGMARAVLGDGRARLRFPHPRGDGPDSFKHIGLIKAISPPAWGWPDGREHAPLPAVDFPTRVGMARNHHHPEVP